MAGLLIYSRFESYLLFHTLAELFAILVAVLMSIVAWQMYSFTRNNYLMFLGCGYFWIAMLDLVHALTFKGMNIYPDVTGSNMTTQLWVASRYLEAALLLVAPVFLLRSIPRGAVFSIFAGLAIVSYLLIINGHFPVAYIEGKGLSPFKIYSEYTIITMLALSIVFLWKRRELLEMRIAKLMIGAVMLTMGSELAFTFYFTVYDVSNLVGHIFKLFSYWLIYVAVICTTLREPFAAMARDVSTYDAIPDAILAVDKDGTVYQANQAALALADEPASGLIGQHCHNTLHPNPNGPETCPVCHHIENQEPVKGMTLYLPELEKWFEYSLSSIGTNSKTTGMVQTIRDTTDKFLAEKARHETEQQLHLLLNSTFEAIYGIDTEDTVPLLILRVSNNWGMKMRMKCLARICMN